MYYKNITLENFRSYEKSTFTFHPKVNIFIGKNAVGKTNLLESIYVTSYGKSFRTTKDKELIQFNKEFCHIKGIFCREITGEEEHEINITFKENGDRQGSVNGLSFKNYSDIFDNVLAVIFSPEDLKMVKESPEKRREFINREMGRLSLSYYRDLMIYRRALQQRNSYLKEDKRDLQLLAIWDENLIKYGTRIINKRESFIFRLNEICQKIHNELTNNDEKIELCYSPNISLCSLLKDNGTEEIQMGEKIKKTKITEEEFRRAFEESLENDLKIRYTSRGPQKDDINIFINGMNARNFASQGQQRTAALSMKMSEVELIKEEKGEYPILLLDDVLSELDTLRQNYLLHSLKDVQLFITTTNLAKEVKKKIPDGKVIFIEKE